MQSDHPFFETTCNMSDLINKHFDENKIRQTAGLFTCEDSPEVRGGVDKSRKGGVDERVKGIVQKLNSSTNYFTVSSCSGRGILLNNKSAPGSSSSGKIIKKACQWHYVAHDPVDGSKLIKALKGLHPSQESSEEPSPSEICFKVEPTIFHVQCRSLVNAKALVHAATESGFRNSGMTLGKDGKITVAIRSTLSMEIPLTIPQSNSDHEQVLEKILIPFWVAAANEKLEENWRRTNKLEEEITKLI